MSGRRARTAVALTVVCLFTVLLCVSAGSVAVPLTQTVSVLWRALTGQAQPAGVSPNIILRVRLPRVLCVALAGAALSLCGAAMQGLLRNPLADGSTLGVSSGASLGAVLALAFGITVPGGTLGMAILFAFLSLLLLMLFAYSMDRSLATGSVILIGTVFSMFATSLISLVTVFAGERVKTITFWTMGSLAGAGMTQVLILAFALLVCGTVICLHAPELNAFSLGEENAGNIGVNVKRVKLTVMAASAVLIGVCVAVGGTIGFVGLIIPHITRFVTGPDHRRLLPCSMLTGAVFLMLADLLARTVASPAELPVGVVTSLVGAVVFAVIFRRTRRQAERKGR